MNAEFQKFQNNGPQEMQQPNQEMQQPNPTPPGSQNIVDNSTL